MSVTTNNSPSQEFSYTNKTFNCKYKLCILSSDSVSLVGVCIFQCEINRDQFGDQRMNNRLQNPVAMDFSIDHDQGDQQQTAPVALYQDCFSIRINTDIESLVKKYAIYMVSLSII